MNQSKLWKQIPQQAAVYYTLLMRDCSTYQFRYVEDDLQVTSLSELEFHKQE